MSGLPACLTEHESEPELAIIFFFGDLSLKSYHYDCCHLFITQIHFALQMRQDEADAVAALLAASGSGEVPGEEAGMGDHSGQPGIVLFPDPPEVSFV